MNIVLSHRHQRRWPVKSWNPSKAYWNPIEASVVGVEVMLTFCDVKLSGPFQKTSLTSKSLSIRKPNILIIQGLQAVAPDIHSPGTANPATGISKRFTRAVHYFETHTHARMCGNEICIVLCSRE